MCGRARCTLRPQDVPRACGINLPSPSVLDSDRFRPSYNVLPGSYMPVLRRDDGSSDGLAVHCMKWGLVPSFTKKGEKPDHFRMFNARSEFIYEKASFRRLVPHHRCIVAVEGFYEWKKDGPKKQPYYIHFKNDKYLVFAALYDSWKSSEGEILYSFTILTTRSSQALQWLHDRMPVILGNQSAISAWLHGPPATKHDSILVPYEEPDLVWYPVTTEMGKISFYGPECVKEIKLKNEETRPISKFFTRKSIETKQETKPVYDCSSQIRVVVEGNDCEVKTEIGNELIDSKKELPVKPELSCCVTVEGIDEEGRKPHVSKQNTVDTSKNSKSRIKVYNDEPKESETVKQEPLEEKNFTCGSYDSSDKNDGEIGLKRDYEKIVSSADRLCKPAGVTETMSPKKTKLEKEVGGKQPTMHSYFRKM